MILFPKQALSWILNNTSFDKTPKFQAQPSIVGIVEPGELADSTSTCRNISQRLVYYYCCITIPMMNDGIWLVVRTDKETGTTNFLLLSPQIHTFARPPQMMVLADHMQHLEKWQTSTFCCICDSPPLHHQQKRATKCSQKKLRSCHKPFEAAIFNILDTRAGKWNERTDTRSGDNNYKPFFALLQP